MLLGFRASEQYRRLEQPRTPFPESVVHRPTLSASLYRRYQILGGIFDVESRCAVCEFTEYHLKGGVNVHRLHITLRDEKAEVRVTPLAETRHGSRAW